MYKKGVIPSLAAIVLIGFVTLTSCDPDKRARGSISEKQARIASSVLAPQVQFNDKQFNPHMDVTPSARGCNNDSGVYFKGSFIYWDSGYTNMTIATRQQNPGVPEPQKLKSLTFDTQYDPGFKVGMGINFQRDVWDLFCNWTSLNSNHTDKQHVHNHQLTALLAHLTPQSQNIYSANKVAAKWNFDLNALDVELGRNFYISKYISLRPFTGLKSAWIDQRLKVQYKDVIDSNGAAFITPVKSQFKDHMWGVGPRVGIDSRWVLGKSNFAFLTNISGSLIWEEFTPHSSTKYQRAGGVEPDLGRVYGHQHELNPIIEVFLGFDWGQCFEERVYLNLSAGYEMQYWWDQLKCSSFFANDPNSALNLHGLTATVRIEF